MSVKKKILLKSTVIQLFLFLLFVLSNSVFNPLSAQSVFKEIPAYEFIAQEKNALVFPGDCTSFQGFFQLLDTLFFSGKGTINIAHFGGSHVQADIVSNRMRLNLLSLQPGIIASRGFVFPFSPAKTNNPYNYQCRYSGKWISTRNVKPLTGIPLGVGGIAISTTDKDAEVFIRLRNNTEVIYDFNRLRLLGNAAANDSLVTLKLNDSVFLFPVFDSVLSSCYFQLPQYTDSFSLVFRQPDSSVFTHVLRGMFPENDNNGITYHSFGVNGASVPSFLRCELLSDELKFVKPDLIVFGVGINDATAKDFDVMAFKRSYHELIRRIRIAAPDCRFIFITNNDSYRRHRRKYHNNLNGEKVRKVFFELAAEYNAAVWDLYSVMGGPESMKLWEKAGLAQHDKVHFTPFGYNLLGDLFYNAFIQAYFQYLSDSQYLRN